MNTQERTGYKIVWGLRTGDLISCFAKEGTVSYAIDEWTKRPNKCGPLAVFKSLKTALEFVDKVDSLKGICIFKCRYLPSKAKRLWYPKKGCKTPHYRYTSLEECPKGTVFANQVKLLELVDRR